MPVSWVRWALAAYLVFLFASVTFLPGLFLVPPYTWPTGVFGFLPFPAFTPMALRILGALGCILSVLFAFGRLPRALPWLLWICLMLITGQLPRIREVQFDYLGYLLIFFGLAPKDWDSSWRRVGMIVLATSYTYTGAFKLTNANWLAPDNWILFEMVLRFPKQTWMLDSHLLSIAIWVQLLALPGALWRRTIFATWVAVTGIQLWILFALKMEHISIAVLLAHLAFVDFSWSKRALQPSC